MPPCSLQKDILFSIRFLQDQIANGDKKSFWSGFYYSLPNVVPDKILNCCNKNTETWCKDRSPIDEVHYTLGGRCSYKFVSYLVP